MVDDFSGMTVQIRSVTRLHLHRKFEPLEFISLGTSGLPILLVIVSFLIVNLGWFSIVPLLVISLLIYGWIKDLLNERSLRSLRTPARDDAQTRHGEETPALLAATKPSPPLSGSLLRRLRRLAMTIGEPWRAGVSRNHIPDKSISAIVFIALLLILILVKFGYIDEVPFPLNIDSVIHVDLIRQLLQAGSLLELPYYHFGFHYIVIALSQLTGAGIAKLILIFGQILQVAAPITLFYPVYRITKNSKAALISLLVAGFAWSMPSQATSWGKYPALLAMASFVFVIYSIQSLIKQDRKGIGQIILWLAIVMTATFIHSRTIILIMLWAFSWLAVRLINRKGRAGQPKPSSILVNFCLVIAFVVVIYFSNIETWDLAFRPYEKTLLAAVVLLLPFSLYANFESSLKIEVFVMLCLLFAAIPMPGFFSLYNVHTLIDRPFLSIFLYIPLSISLGISFAGLERFVTDQMGKPLSTAIQWIPFAVLAVLLLLFPNKYVLKPVPGAVLVSSNDPFLYRDIQSHLPEASKILIPNDSPYYELGLDGGAWIDYTTDRRTVKMSYTADLTSAEVFQEICSEGVQYIYLGDKPQSFSMVQIQQRKDWYSPLMDYPDAKLYQVMHCPVQ